MQTRVVPFYKDTSLWKKVLSNKYQTNSSLLEAQVKPNQSKVWKGLIKQREFLASSLCYQINNGATTFVWKDPWIPSMSPPLPIPSSSEILKDSTLRVSELMLEEPRRWNIMLLQALFSEETAKEIEKIPLALYNFQNLRDEVKWIHHSS